MIRKIAQYKVGKGNVEEATDTVREFVRAVREEEPGVTYEAYRLDDGVTFLHVVAFQTEEEEGTHQTAPHTLHFFDNLYLLCEEEPSFVEVTPIE